MLGSVKVGDKLRVQIRGTKAYFPDAGVSGVVENFDAAPTYTVRVQAEKNDHVQPIQRWPVRDIVLRVGAVQPPALVSDGEVLDVRMVRRA